MHLALDDGDEGPAVPELCVGPVQAEEVRDIGNDGSQVGPCVVAIPFIMDLVPAPTAPPPPPVAKAPEVRETPPLPDVDIALEREKKRKLLRQQKEAEIRQAQKLQEKRDAELQARREKELAERQAQALAQKAEAKKQAARELANEKEKRTAAANAAVAAEKQKQAAAASAAAEKQKTLAAITAAANAVKQKLAAAAAAAAAKQRQAAEAAAASEKQRQTAIQQRIMSMAGAAGSGSSGAGVGKAGGPSAGYAGKVRAKVLPNVVFTDEISGNPKAEVEVNTTSDGTIMSQRLFKSSGSKAWDDAVIKAIVRTGSLPRDVDGRVPTPMIIEFRPN